VHDCILIYHIIIVFAYLCCHHIIMCVWFVLCSLVTIIILYKHIYVHRPDVQKGHLHQDCKWSDAWRQYLFTEGLTLLNSAALHRGRTTILKGRVLSFVTMAAMATTGSAAIGGGCRLRVSQLPHFAQELRN